MNRVGVALCLLIALALAAAGCGGGDETSAATSQAKATTTVEHQDREAAPAEEGLGYTKIYRAESATLGRILFNEYGFTLYRFSSDEGSTPSCYGACAERWPPYIAEGEFKARKLLVLHHMGRTRRKGGAMQVTYFGHPLYTFAGDKQTGESNGNEVRAFGGQWHALHPSGEDAEGGSSS